MSAYDEYIARLRRLIALIHAKEDVDDGEGDALRDEMDTFYYQLTEEEIQLAEDLATDLMNTSPVPSNTAP